MSAEQNSSISDSASAKPPPALKKRQLSALQCQQPNFLLGQQGETRAVAFLVSHHYRILDQNIRLGTREIDIIAHDPETDELVFVEVKTRNSAEYGSPVDAINRSKLRSLETVARVYKRSKRLWLDHRFDSIAVLPDSIEHYQNISWNF